MLGNVLDRRELEDGGFYYVNWRDEVILARDAWHMIWYLKDGTLHSPVNYECTRDGSEWCFIPLTLDNVETDEGWIVEKGDIRGQLAWENYKAKLRMKDMERKEEKEVKMDNDVDLYNPKFVHFDWDEDLKGKKGFFACDIGTIKKELHYKGPCMMGTLLQYSDNESRPFVVKFQGGSGEWRFFYYDPNFEIKWAYFKEGKHIQIRRDSMDTWKDLCSFGETGTTIDVVIANIKGPGYFDDDFEYRIKPEEEAEPEISVDVDINVKKTSNVGSIKVQINGKEVVFENVDQARLVLGV